MRSRLSSAVGSIGPLSGLLAALLAMFAGGLLILASPVGGAESGVASARNPRWLSSVPQRRRTIPVQRSQRSELGPGKFLVASRELRDPNFLETVVLLINYDGEKGAMGLVINRETEVELAVVFPDVEVLQGRDDSVFIGGPVERSGMMLLIRSEAEIDEAERVFADVQISGSRDLLAELAALDDPPVFRTYAGYSGWSAGQLEMEIEQGAWHILPAEADTVFDPEPRSVWPRLIQRTDVRYVRAAPLPGLPWS